MLQYHSSQKKKIHVVIGYEKMTYETVFFWKKEMTKFWE